MELGFPSLQKGKCVRGFKFMILVDAGGQFTMLPWTTGYGDTQQKLVKLGQGQRTFDSSHVCTTDVGESPGEFFRWKDLSYREQLGAARSFSFSSVWQTVLSTGLLKNKGTWGLGLISLLLCLSVHTSKHCIILAFSSSLVETCPWL